MAKQLNSYEVKLDFKADTSQAKKEIQQFQQSLTNLMTQGSMQYNFGKDLAKNLGNATHVVSQLKQNLQEAFNVDTGKLDLGKFQESMKRSGNDLQTYKNALLQLGPEGKQAFNQLVDSIAAAEIPLKRSNALLTEFWTTLKNTARWQISSSLLHGFMSTIQHAYGYAQDLNESLNNIRIVTGYNVDKMAEFAANANKAAQALSTTTTAYTDAALIYYQQGLGDEEVLGRTDVTVKMANVSRQSAEEVSDQLTAIWNNFYDGSKSLEYYADVITALGAATASSSEEISTGLEKFAAVADTVGLSYEYATAALATITATTRQSAETVGTGLRTLFARLEGLKLGETLEDGVDLNKYSAALNSIGVQILDVNGNIKDMDTILNETAAGWDKLSKAQQVAFAQTVGGVRQYTNLIALMDNWDFMQSNLGVAGDAEGTLQKQADIYAESWEAAQKRVKAAAEDIYGALLDDKFFIKLNDLLANILKGIKSFIDSIGGLKGALSGLGVLATTIFRDQIGKSINDIVYNLRTGTVKGYQQQVQFQTNAVRDRINTDSSLGTNGKDAFATSASLHATAQEEVLQISQRITEEEKKIKQERLDSLKIEGDKLKTLGAELDSVKAQAQEQKKLLETKYGKYIKQNPNADEFNLLRTGKTVGRIEDFRTHLLDYSKKSMAQRGEGLTHREGLLNELKDIGINDLKETLPEANEQIDRLFNLLGDGKSKAVDIKNAIKDLEAVIGTTNYASQESTVIIAQNIAKEKGLTEGTKEYDQFVEKVIADIDTYNGLLYKEGELTQQTKEKTEGLTQAYKGFHEENQHAAQQAATLGENITSVANAFLSFSSILNSIKGLANIWSNEDISLGEQLIQTMSSLAMITTIVLNLRRQHIIENLREIKTKITQNITTAAATVVENAETSSIITNTAALIANKLAIEGVTAATVLMIGKVLLIIGIIALLTAAIYKSIQSANDFDKKIKDSEKITEDLKENYDKLKESAEEFANATRDYQEGVKALEDLKDNQEEYNKALEESNKKARDLIETYGLYGQYQYGKDGTIIIDESALKAKQNELDTSVNDAEMLVLRSKAYTNSLTNLKKVNDSSEKLNDAIESLYRELNPQNFGVLYDWDQTDTLQKAFNDFSKEVNTDIFVLEDFNKYLEENNISLKGIGSELDNEVFQTLQEYCESLRGVTESNKYFSEQILRASIENSDLGQKAREMATKNGQLDEGLYNSVISMLASGNAGTVSANLEGINLGAGNKANLQNLITLNPEAAKAFFGGLGADVDNFDNWDVRAVYGALAKGGKASDYRGGGGLRQNQVLDDVTGKVVIDNTPIEQMIRTIMEQFAVYAATTTTEFSDDVLAEYENLVSESGDNAFGLDFSEAIRAALTANPEDFTENFDITNVLDQLTPTIINQLLSLSDTALGAIFGEGTGFGAKLREQLENIDIDSLIETINQKYNEKAKDLDLDVDAFDAYRRILADTNPELAKNIELLNKVAIADKRVERGAKTLLENWEDYNEIITRVGDNSQDLSTILPEIEKALADIANVNIEDIKELGTDFVTDNWDLITDSINGSTTALDELQAKISGMTLKNYLISIGVDNQAAINDIMSLHDEIASVNDLPIEIPINEGPFLDKCNDLIMAAQMTQEQAQEYFSKLGFDTEFETQKQKVTEWVPNYESRYEVVEEGEGYRIQKKNSSVTWEPVDGEIEVPALKSITPNKSYGGNIKRLGGGGGGGKKSSGGGGGKTAAAENQKTTSKDDAGIKRYKEIDDALQDIAEDQERINKLTDTYYGANKVKAMKQRAEMLKQEADLHKKKYEWAKKYQDEDLANLQGFAADHGMNLDFQQEYDAVTGKTRSGSLTNYTAIMENLYSQLNEKETHWAKASNFGSKEAQDEYKKKYIDPIAETIKEFDKLVGIYDDSRKTLDEEANDYLDRIIEAQEATYAAYKEDWDLKLEILEDQRKFLDHSKKLLGDSAVELGEAMALIGTKEGEGYLANTLGNITELARQEKELESIREEIGEDNYYNRLKEIRDGYLENTEALKELDDEMMEYYGKVMDKVNQEVEKYIKNMETLKKTLQSYQKVLKVTGRETDYDAMDDLLRGEASVIQAQYDTKAEQYELYQREVAKAEAALKAAEKSHDEKAIESQKKRLETAKTNLQEVGNEMLDILAEKAENAKAIMDNMRAKIMASYEDAMTNGLGFDYLDATMERYSTIQDLYLTKTNQVFETTKMLRKIQTDMDSTSNRAAKQRLNNFAKEIESLKARDKMTKADLELAQKRYDLLLAQIALEEAQKAKTTVRLQRDNEGNYGYVYTADEGDIAKAQDDMLNAENDLYNTRLRIANESGEAIYQINEEWMNAINELVEEYENDRNMSEEEFNKKKEEINKYYLGLMAVHSHNFTEAQKEDARVVADAWINNHDHDLPTVMEVTEKFGEVSTKTLDRVDVALDEFKQVIDDVVDEQEDRFGDSVDITHDVETAAKDLAKEIRDDLRHEYKQLFDRVGNMIDQYSKERSYILNSVIPAYTDQAKAIQEVINKRKELATVQDQPQQKYDGTGGGNGSATVGAGTGNGGSGGGGGGGNPPAGGSPTYSGNNKQGGKGLDFANEQAEAADSSSWKEDLLTTSRLNTFGMNKLGYKEGSKLLTVFVNAYKGKKKKDLVSSYPAYEKYIANLATGGYTGEWNDGSGKLAVLHSKELVLNAQDTENMLAVVDMVRQVVNSIDMNAASLAGGYGALSSGGGGAAGPQTLEQNVQITASFPNATNHSEIEEAFNNLINKASQYASRTR